jgi:hypothetical protein
MMKVKWISYGTPRYAGMLQRLEESLMHFDLDYELKRYPQEFSDKVGDRYMEAVKYKPEFILQHMEKHEGYDAIVWTDADSQIRKKPTLLYELECELGVRYRNGVELLAGTMYFRRSYKMHRVVEIWCKAMREDKEMRSCPEQQVLQALLPQMGLDVFKLPEEYVYVAPHEGCDMRDVNNRARHVEPVIYHYQASREMRLT